jgi:hypothetical protein
MALPVTISAVQFPDQNYFCGPFKAPNGAIYVVLQDSTTQSPEVHKCVDFDFPASAFAVQTGGTDPTLGTAGSMWAYLSGNHIHIAYNEDDGTDNYYYYARFDTSDDSWEAADEQIDTWDDKYEPTAFACSIVERADDGGQEPTVVLHNGPQDKIGGTYYNRVHYAYRTTGASWTTRVDVDAAGEVNYSGCVAVRGSAPDANGHVVHFFYGQTTSGYARTLRYNSGWQLSAVITCPDSTIQIAHRFSHGIYYLDGSTDRIAVAYPDGGNAPYVWMVPEDSSGDVDGNNDNFYLVDSSSDTWYLNGFIVGCLAIDRASGKAYAVYSEDNVAGYDLRRNDASAPWSSWPSSTEEEAGTCNRISCNVYPRNGSLKLAFVWLDGTTIKYDEYDIGQETAPGFAAARLPQQNYSIGPFSV